MEKFLRGHNLQFIEDVPTRLLCIKCNSILCNPHTVPCGHNYCWDCIVSHLENSENKKCVGAEYDCRNEEIIITNNVLKSFNTIREIKELKVQCILENCNEIVELKNLENHVNNCSNKLLECPFKIVGYNMIKINKEGVKQHLCDAGVEHASIMVEHIQELKNSNNELKLENEMLKKTSIDKQNTTELEIENIKRGAIDQQNNFEFSLEQIYNQISNLKESGDEKQNRIEALEAEIERNKVKMTQEVEDVERKLTNKWEKENSSLKKEITNLKESGDEKQSRIEALEADIQRNKVKMMQEVEDVERKLTNKWEKENSFLKKEITNLKESGDEKQSRIEALEAHIQRLSEEQIENKVKMTKVDDIERKLNEQLKLNTKLEKENVSLKNKIEENSKSIKEIKEKMKTKTKLEEGMKTVKSFIPKSVLEVNSYDWIVANYTSKFNAACDDPDTCFESAPFYLQGYRLQLQLFPRTSGCVDGRSGYVGIKFKLLGGEYDDLVSWPCPLNLKFGIIDSQNTNFTALLRGWSRSDYTTSNKGESEWERPGDVSRVSPVYSLCWSPSPMEKSKKLLNGDCINIRTKVIK